MPVFFIGFEPNNITGMNFFYRAAFMLYPSGTCCNNQCLSQRMRVPGRSCARLKGNAGGSGTPRFIRLKQRINPHFACKPAFRTF